MVIQRFSGVLLTVDDARYLADVLDAACRVTRPSPRVTQLAARLRKAAGTSASANETASARANDADPGEIRAHDLLTAGEAAAILGCSPANVRYLRAHGHLPAHSAGGRWLYPAAPVVGRAERKAARQG
jgi:hypothetical protein